MLRVESGESTEEEDVIGKGRGKSEINWDEVDGEKEGAVSWYRLTRDKVKRIKRNDQLCITRMMLVVERG